MKRLYDTLMTAVLLIALGVGGLFVVLSMPTVSGFVIEYGAEFCFCTLVLGRILIFVDPVPKHPTPSQTTALIWYFAGWGLIAIAAYGYVFWPLLALLLPVEVVMWGSAIILASGALCMVVFRVLWDRTPEVSSV